MKRKRHFLIRTALALFMVLCSTMGWGQTSVQDFGTGTGTHSSTTGSSNFIPNPTSGATYARGGGGGTAPIVLATASNPLGTTDTYVRAVASSSTSVAKFSPAVGYTSSTEFYTSFKVLFGNASGAATATSGSWTFYQGSGSMYTSNGDFAGADVFTGLRFNYAAGGVVNVDNRTTSWTSTGISITQGVAHTIEIVGNNASSGTINYSYNGVNQSVAFGTYDFYVDGVLVGNDLQKGGRTAGAAINSTTFIGISSTSNVANIFVDDVVIYNDIPGSIGTQAKVATPTISATGSPNGVDTFWDTADISLATTTPNSTIYYTVNGGPTLQYLSSFTIAATSVIEAYAEASGLADSDIATKTVTITPTVASFTTSPTSITGLNYGFGSGPSVAQNFTLEGSNLDNSNVTIAAPANFEISQSETTGYANSIILNAYDGTSQTVWVRLASGLALGSYTGDVSISGGGVATALTLSVSGDVLAQPTVTASSQNGTVGAAFTYQVIATENPDTYTLASGTLPGGLNLDASTGIISGTPTSAGIFTANITATNTAGTSAPAAIEITIGKGIQTATLNDINVIGDATPIVLPANTNAGISISYTSGNPAVATVFGNTLTFVGAGIATITASNAGDANYEPFSDDFTATAAYCTPTATDNDHLGITEVSFADLNNSAGGSDGAYTDFSNLVANVTAGNSYDLTVNANTGGPYVNVMKAWIDWNKNFIFEAGEEYDLGSATDVVNGATSLSPLSIQIPPSAAAGQYRMRIRGHWDSAPVPCGNQDYSEAEDYTISVQTSFTPLLFITGTTDHGTSCVNTATTVQSYTIENAGISAADGLTVVSDNSQFVVSNLSATTVPGSNGTVTFDVTFTPTSAGVQNATITVQSSTSGSNVATFDITGTGNTTVDPALATSAATSISATEATLNGDITSLGTCLSNPLTEKGFVYGTSVNPEFNGGTFLTDGTAATGVFDATVTTLSPATTYYYKAYVMDGTGQYYFSNELSFTTTLDAPVATAATNITPAGFTANWNAVTGADSYVVEVSEITNSGVTEVFKEQFNAANGTGGNDNSWSGSIATVSFKSDNIGWDATAANSGQSCAKLGSSSTNGSLTTPVLGFIGDGTLTFRAGAWDSGTEQTVLNISISGGGSLSANTVSLIKGSFSNYSITITGATTNTKVTLFGNKGIGGNNSNSRFFIDDIIVTTNSLVTTPISGSPFTITPPATSYDVTGLNPDSNYTYTVKAVKGAVESAVSNTITVTTAPAPASTTYAGGSWTNGAPNSPDTDAVISENYNGVGFTAKDITVSSGAALTIPSGQTIAAANITVEDNANFIQEDGSTLNLTGTMTLNKNATSAADRYVFWSSPVAGQNVYDIYPAGTPQFVMTYNSDTDLYPTVANPTIAAAGVGYSVKVPLSATAAQFTGAPNSGDIPVSLDHVANANGNTWNLIGNPYPSNLNLQSLYNGGGIGSSIYFWDNITATNTTQQQAATTWAVYNAANGTWSNTGNAGLGIDGNNNLVKPGQGFIVQATAPSITFTNAMRTAATANFINKGMNPGEGKFWLKLATPAGTQFQTAVTYGGGALNTFEAFDSKVMSVGANGIYSYLGTDKLAIQGRDYFVNTDVVIIGNKHSASCQYTFSLAGKTGLFDAGQAIYLKDKQTNIYTNLQTDSYTFLSDALEQQDRFEIVYQPQAALGTAETVKTETVVYKEGDHFTVKASEKILSIEVYDASGRHIGTVKPDSTTAQVTAGSRGMYLLKIKTVNSETVKKVIK